MVTYSRRKVSCGQDLASFLSSPVVDVYMCTNHCLTGNGHAKRQLGDLPLDIAGFIVQQGSPRLAAASFAQKSASPIREDDWHGLSVRGHCIISEHRDSCRGTSPAQAPAKLSSRHHNFTTRQPSGIPRHPRHQPTISCPYIPSTKVSLRLRAFGQFAKIQRRLAWSLHKDDTLNQREATNFFGPRPFESHHDPIFWGPFWGGISFWSASRIYCETNSD